MPSLEWSESWRMRNLNFTEKAKEVVIVPKSRRGKKKSEFSVTSVDFIE